MKYVMKLRADEILKACKGELVKGSITEREFTFSTDTRSIKPGDIYIPLKGEKFDGENFIAKALEAGASGCLTTRDNIDAQLVIKVKNTLDSYMSISEYYKDKQNGLITIGITGSSGKTTTKEMLYSVISEKFNTQKTLSNHNNEIGFCETINTMPENTEVVIIEMGMRGLGQIELIAKHAKPDIGIITNAGSAHIGILGSLDNIAKAKCELTGFIKPDGAFIALNQDRIKKFCQFEGEKIYYTLDEVKILEQKPSYTKFLYKENEYELNVEGLYNVENSLAAIETGLKLNMTASEIQEGLKKYHPIEKRWEVQKINGYKFINDSYNANPDSMKASVSTFMELYPDSVVILGDMGELGEQETALHKEVGKYLATKPHKTSFITVGLLAEKTGEELKRDGFAVKSFESNCEAARYILENVNVGTTIFLKASRAMKFEEIINIIKGENTL